MERVALWQRSSEICSQDEEGETAKIVWNLERWVSIALHTCPTLWDYLSDVNTSLDGEEGDIKETSETPVAEEFSAKDEEQDIRDKLEDLTDIVDRLFDLVPSLQWITRPYATEEEAAAKTSPFEGILPEAMIYHGHILDKFPDVSPTLARTLAEANWRRFERLEKSRAEEEYAEIREEENYAHAVQEVKHEEHRSIIQPSHHDSGYGTASHTASQPSQLKPDQAIAFAQRQPRHPMIREIDQETVYSSVYSGEDASGTGERLRFPTPPVDELGEQISFTCNVCGKMVRNIENKRQWR
jgi:hypothetical protein